MGEKKTIPNKIKYGDQLKFNENHYGMPLLVTVQMNECPLPSDQHFKHLKTCTRNAVHSVILWNTEISPKTVFTKTFINSMYTKYFI